MNQVLVFAKAPRAGFAKTRLAAEIGAEKAVDIYRAIGRRVVDQVSRFHGVTIWFDPPDALEEMRAWLGEHEYLPQSGGDLGDRMSFAFDAQFRRQEGPLVAIGTDAPDVDARVVGAALLALEQADGVFGPALDGGYYLVGLKRPAPEIFRGVEWGGPGVLRATLSRCADLRLTVSLLEPLRDIDTLADLTSWRGTGGGRVDDGLPQYDGVE